MINLKTIFSEPLIHFLFLGFLLFLYYKVTAEDIPAQNKTVIEISQNEIIKIKTEYRNEYNKEIDKNHLQALIDKKYYEKLLLDEAYSLGLYNQDEVISQRLLKRMNSIMLNSSERVEPTEKMLLEYYKQNIDDYSEIKTLSFAHIFFSDRADKKVAQTLNLLKIAKIKPEKASSFGEKFIHSNFIKNISFKSLKNEYGNYFASQVFKLKEGVWHQSILSKYGVHLIYITGKKIGKPYPFDEVQDRVYQDYLTEQSDTKKRASYKKIEAQYILKIELKDNE